MIIFFLFNCCLSNTYTWETQGDTITFSCWIQHLASFMRHLDNGRRAGFCVLPCQGFWCLSQELGSFVLLQQKVQLMQGPVWTIFLLNLNSVIRLGKLRGSWRWNQILVSAAFLVGKAMRSVCFLKTLALFHITSVLTIFLVSFSWICLFTTDPIWLCMWLDLPSTVFHINFSLLSCPSSFL